MVQIASAVGTGAKILVFDEPTSSLSEPEAQNLFKLIDQLKTRGVTMIYVSHRMPEVFRLCDRFTVLRDGKYVGTLKAADATQDAVVRMMIGRSIEAYFPHYLSSAPGKVILEVKNLSSPGRFRDVSFNVRAGEIVGFAGLVGAGRSEVAKAIFGLDKEALGQVSVDGKPMSLGNVRLAMRRGLGLVPEDRKRQGLVLMMGGRQNFSLAMLERFRRLGFIDTRRERRQAAEYFDRLRVKTPSLESPVAGMSGGTQQKVALAKWLGRGARLLIVDEPTRGVDVGAKAAIHGLIDELARQGIGILLISSELPELLNLSTRSSGDAAGADGRPARAQPTRPGARPAPDGRRCRTATCIIAPGPTAIAALSSAVKCILQRKELMHWNFLLAQPEAPNNTWEIVIAIVVIIICLVIFGLMAQFIGLYIRALSSGARVQLHRAAGHAPASRQCDGHRHRSNSGHARRTAGFANGNGKPSTGRRRRAARRQRHDRRQQGGH